MVVHQKKIVVDGMTPVGVYAALRGDAGNGCFLLESVVPGERWGRYSVLGYRPRSHVALYGEQGVDPFRRLSELIPSGSNRVENVAERFVGAHVGMLAYDMVHYVTKVPGWAPRELDYPIARLVGDATVIVFDNLDHTATIASTQLDDIERAEADLANVAPLAPLVTPDANALPEDVSVNVSDAEYGKAVEICKEYIRAGDAFQIVPARTLSTPADGADVFDVYRALRRR
jgi:anthranilate synthase component 1